MLGTFVSKTIPRSAKAVCSCTILCLNLKTVNCTRRGLWDRLFGQGFDSPHLHQTMVIRTLRFNRVLQSGVFVCIVISDFKRITTHDDHADKCREKYSPILVRLFSIPANRFEEETYFVYRKLARLSSDFLLRKLALQIILQ